MKIMNKKFWWGLIFFVFIFSGCKKNHYHLMPEQKQFLSPFSVGISFKMLKNKTDTISFNVVKNEITTYSSGKKSVVEKGYVKIVNQANENQIWEINMFADDRYSRVSVLIDTNYIFYNTCELFNDTNINTIDFNQLYEFISLTRYYKGTMGLSPLKGFAFVQCVYNGDTITYDQLP